ncbi:MAG: excinuclease ABC subunit UvrA [Minisyncoccia bacterium]
MVEDFIKIRGARVHNLKNINVDIPKNKLVVITGISGSGKSSLAFDTLYAEGQRRYVESLSAYARQFLGVMQKPDVDKIEGISPAISIDQRKAGGNPRSTVGTMTEIYDYLRVLFARIGIPHCPKCHRKVQKQTIDQIIEQILNFEEGTEITILAPVIKGKKGEHKAIIEEIESAGFSRVRIDGKIYPILEAKELNLDRYKIHNIEVVIDRLLIEKTIDKKRLVESTELALKMGQGRVIVSKKNKNKKEDVIFSEHFACEYCGISLPEIEPRLFSFNSPYGACPSCQGLGKKLIVDPELVIPNKKLSIAQGAIFPWAHASHKIGRQGYFWWQLEELSKKYNFSLYEPIENLSKETIDLILYGDGNFEGVIYWLEKKYWQTNSDYAKEEISKYMKYEICNLCGGKRLKPEALAVTILKKSIYDICELQIDKTKKFFENLLIKLNENELKISQLLIKEILNRLNFLIDVGLDYLTLNRESDSLSGGEEQRTRLATQIGSQLTGVLYILDEPSIGLHPRDQSKLINTLKKLRDLKNSVIVVEHDAQTILAADWVIDIGPGAGKEGGNIVFSGTPQKLLKSNSLTGQYLSGRKKIEVNLKSENNLPEKYLIIKGAKEHNLKNINVKIPLGKFVCVTGVSGSGKSTLIVDILAKALYKKFYNSKEEAGKYEEILGLENIDKVILVDQSPIGKTPRSNPATYTGIFSIIRYLFSQTTEAKIRGYNQGRFSFNIKGGRCEECQGQGVKKIEMYFLPDVYIPCPECQGKRYNKETLEIEYRGKNIAQVLEMTVKEALDFFSHIPLLKEKFQILYDVGLGYIQLGQSATSLSGGEAQRVKLATELSKKATGKTIYILDEPTTGLHFDDIKKLVFILKKLVQKGNTVIVIEHNLDLIKNADWIIDLGPEGGERGGYIVAYGPPKSIIKVKKSYTGKYLKKVL